MSLFGKSANPRRSSSFSGLILLCLLASTRTAPSQARTVSATIDVSKTGTPISKYIYGQFLEHGGDIVNAGMWSEMLADRKFFYPVQTSVPTPPPAIGNAAGNPRFHQWSNEIHVPQTIEGTFGQGSQEMIVVLPDSKTIYNGSMYSSSQTTGDFEKFIYHDASLRMGYIRTMLFGRNAVGRVGSSRMLTFPMVGSTSSTGPCAAIDAHTLRAITLVTERRTARKRNAIKVNPWIISARARRARTPQMLSLSRRPNKAATRAPTRLAVKRAE